MVEKCEICGATKNLQRHHISYEPEILQSLCVACHRNIHGHGVGSVGFTGTGANLLENAHEEIIMLCEAGASNTEIANAIGVGAQTVSRWKGILGFGGQGKNIKKENKIMKEKTGYVKTSYIEERVIRADNTIMLGLKMVGNSGLKQEEKVEVITKIGSGKIVIERMKKGEN